MGFFTSIFERRNDIGIREHFEALFKNTRDSVWAVEFIPGIPCKLDPDLQADKILHGQFIYANESMKKIFNLKSDSDIVGKTIQQFGVSLKPTFKQDQINFIKNGYEIIQCDEVKVHDTGEVRFIYCEIRGLIKNKKLTQMWAISRDITDEKKAEHHLHQLEKLQALGQMAGGIAHDFKNLITIIKGTAEIVEKDPSEIQKLSKVIETCSRADELCKRILIFSKNKKKHT
jgi:PAS domain S-box-containing protein